ncbi:hypothetical protein D3C77_451230 [compost metagenome]
MLRKQLIGLLQLRPVNRSPPADKACKRLALSLNEVKASEASEEQGLPFIQLIYGRLQGLVRQQCPEIFGAYDFTVPGGIHNPRRVDDGMAVIQRNMYHIQRRSRIA